MNCELSKSFKKILRGVGGRGVMVNAIDCWIVVSEFQSQHYVNLRTNTLGKGMYNLILPGVVKILTLLFFSKDDFGINKSG